MEKEKRPEMIADSEIDQVAGGVSTTQTAMKCPKCGSPVTAQRVDRLTLYRCMNCGYNLSGKNS